MSRFNGEFPIFGKDSKIGDLKDSDGLPYDKNEWFHYFFQNQHTYFSGNLKDKEKSLKGILHFITSALNDLYAKGIPDFRNNVEYKKGAVVSFDNGIYVSLCDSNAKHVTQSSHWNKVSYLPNDSIHNTNKECNTSESNNYPIGTILTVPVNTEITGFIDFKDGTKFDPILYPELYKSLGTNVFSSGINVSSGSELPIGSIVHCLSIESSIPNGWIEWKSTYGLLNNYPELKDVLGKMANRLPFGSIRDSWINSLNNNTLPNFSLSGFFLKFGNSIGNYENESLPSFGFNTLPMIIDETSSLNPLGYRRETVSNEVHSITTGTKFGISNHRSPFVLLGKNTTTYGSNDLPMAKVEFGNTNSNELNPKCLTTKLLVKASNNRNNNIPVTHKQIIKAF